MTSGIGHKCMRFLCCGWACDFSDILIDQMTSHILCKCESSLHYGWACAFSELQLVQMTSDIEHKHMVFLWCGWSGASSMFQLDQMTSHILSKCGPSHHCGWSCAFSNPQLDQMIFDIGHRHESLLCCWLPCASPDALLDLMTVRSLKKCLSLFHHCELTFGSPIQDSLIRMAVYVDVSFERSEPFPSSEQTAGMIFTKGNTLSLFPSKYDSYIQLITKMLTYTQSGGSRRL